MRERDALVIGLFLAVGLLLLALAPSAEAEYAVDSFVAVTTDSDGNPYTVAGGHPFQSIDEFSITAGAGGEAPAEMIDGSYVRPPPGFIGNPSAAPRCVIGNLRLDTKERDVSECPSGSRVGIADVTRTPEPFGRATPDTFSRAIYNLVPERGYPAQFGFVGEVGVPVILSVLPQSRADSYGLTFAHPNSEVEARVLRFRTTLCSFGIEGEAGSGPHPFRCELPFGVGDVPFLSNPTDCSVAEPTWNIAIDSLEHAGILREPGVPELSDPDWKTASFVDAAVSGCDEPLLAGQFDPAISARPLQAAGPLQADKPSGFAVEIGFPQSNDPTDPNTTFDPAIPQAPPPKDITVRLPAGLAISPSAANGLGACSDLASDPAGDQVRYESTQPVRCPDSAKIGDAVATSPLLATRDFHTGEANGAEPIPGEVYLLKPHPGDLRFGGEADGKFRLLIELENPRYGVNVKLPGMATADRQTGQLTAVFTRSPQLPVRHLAVSLTAGPRAPLVTPAGCGKYEISTTMVPWSTPGTPDAHPGASFEVETGAGGSSCPPTAAARPFSPALGVAGSDSAKAGAATPFTLELTRPDGDQELSSLSFTAPPGFTAKLKGVASCPDGAIAAAAANGGAAERADPSCPAASRVGSVTAAAGAGPNPYYAKGTAYLAGPYQGAPLSFAFITPALAGSFDLGNIVFRAGAHIDPQTAQVTIKSDELPQLLAGIPLRLRSIAIRLDRPDFTLNPTGCEPSSVPVAVTSANGARANPTAYFQVGGCKDLRFKPRLGLEFLGALEQNGHPSIRATLRARPGEASIAATTITFPEGELLDLHRLGALCARGLDPERCPRSSRLGRVRVWSPLLADSLQGPVYLREPGGGLPDLIADLRGDGLRLLLRGHTSAPAGRLRIRLPALPDAPLAKALITLFGGARGIFVNSESLCRRPRRAAVGFDAHNGVQRQLRPLLRLRGRC